jgi:hypothetical protein
MKNTLALSAVAGLIASGLIAQAHAMQLDALLLPDENRSNAEFAGVRFIDVKYPQGSSIANLLDGKNERIEFTINGSINSADNGMDKVIQAVNGALRENKSPVVVENAMLHYFAVIKGYPDRTQVSYRVEFKPTITGYVLQAANGSQPAIVDLDWRDIAVGGPLMVKTEQYSAVNINQPIGAVELLFPDLAGKLTGFGAKEIMEDPIMNFKPFGLPMKSWHFLFDVTGKQLERYGVFVKGEGGTVSIHSIGESSFREGTYVPVEKDAGASIDGVSVSLHASTPPPSGQITIAGYSSVDEKDGSEFAVVSAHSPGLPPLGFQFQVLLVLGGMMAVVAVVVLIKARK